MKYIKKFESAQIPKVGDYIVSDGEYFSDAMREFSLNEIGKIIKIKNRQNVSGIPDYVVVKYEKDKIPNELLFYFNYDEKYDYSRTFELDRIRFFSKNIEDVEIYLTTNKYNL